MSFAGILVDLIEKSKQRHFSLYASLKQVTVLDRRSLTSLMSQGRLMAASSSGTGIPMFLPDHVTATFTLMPIHMINTVRRYIQALEAARRCSPPLRGPHPWPRPRRRVREAGGLSVDLVLRPSSSLYKRIFRIMSLLDSQSGELRLDTSSDTPRTRPLCVLSP